MSEADQPFFPKWARYIILPGLFGPVFVLVFVFITELAHDEARCPYVHGETRALGSNVFVREDSRNCLWDVEDHRFSVIRDGQERVLGRRRFRSEAFAQGHYEWSAELDSKDQVHVLVKNAGHDDAKFREGTLQERAER